MNFFLSYIILAEIFAIVALSTNFLVGVIGIFSVSQAAITSPPSRPASPKGFLSAKLS
jgi:ABC-type branched-subunit amino acid transport system permease subunit